MITKILWKIFAVFRWFFFLVFIRLNSQEFLDFQSSLVKVTNKNELDSKLISLLFSASFLISFSFLSTTFLRGTIFFFHYVFHFYLLISFTNRMGFLRMLWSIQRILNFQLMKKIIKYLSYDTLATFHFISNQIIKK